MAKFNYCNVPDQWGHAWTKYPQGETILEALLDWISQVDSMVDNVNDWNTYLDGFKESFDTELQSTVEVILQDWKDNGLLAEIFGQLQDALTDRLAVAESHALDETNATELGTLRNASEQTYVYPNRLADPFSIAPPMAKTPPRKGFITAAHYYMDNGLEKTASASGQANGSYQWYDWSWNFTTRSDYDPARHPLLGWYAGDNPLVLDWHCYWLATYGIDTIIPVGQIDTTQWSIPSNSNHWIYQMFNNAKNFKSLKYIPWLKENGTVTDCNTQHNDILNNLIPNYSNFAIYKVNNKRYPMFYVWDIEIMRGVYDNYNGTTNTRNHLIDLSTQLKGMGYDGICIMGRNFKYVADGVWNTAVQDILSAGDVLMFEADYSTRYGSDSLYNNNYSDYVDNAVFPDSKTTINNVVTAGESKNHPSNWTLRGSTPELFREILQRAVNNMVIKQKPKIITIYNVAEWAEGGASLQPNVKDGFGYLKAVQSVGAIPIENYDLEEVKTDAKTLSRTNDKQFYRAKKVGITLNGGAGGTHTVTSFDLAGTFGYNDNANDYVFMVTPEYPSADTVYNIDYYVKPDFNNSKLWVTFINAYGAEVTPVNINLLIIKLTI